MLYKWLLSMLFAMHIANLDGISIFFTHYSNTAVNTGVKMDFTFTNTRPQLVNLTYQSNITLGNNILFKLSLFTVMNTNKNLLLMRMSFKEGPCYFANHYIGKYIHDLETLAGIVPGLCPIPMGKYTAANYKSNFENFRFPNMPNGNLFFTSEFIEKKSNRLVAAVNLRFKLEHD